MTVLLVVLEHECEPDLASALLGVLVQVLGQSGLGLVLESAVELPVLQDLEWRQVLRELLVRLLLLLVRLLLLLVRLRLTRNVRW